MTPDRTETVPMDCACGADLTEAGFDEAMKQALRAEDVLRADETPTNVISKNTDTHGRPTGARGYSGYLVRDDYAGWHQYDPQLAGAQQCAAY